MKANANDSAYCAALADHAVHAAMAGFTCVSVAGGPGWVGPGVVKNWGCEVWESGKTRNAWTSSRIKGKWLVF